VPPAELLRVLAVRGAAVVGGKVVRKPTDDRIDGWFTRWYDASGNCASRDRVAGFPEAMQWQHGPAMEDGTGDGKIPYIADGYLVHLGGKDGVLVCRDAGNGTLLWTRYVGLRQNAGIAIAAGRVHLWHDAKAERSPDPKRMAERGPLVAIDLATGEMVQTYGEGLQAGTAKPIEWMDGDRRRRDTPVPWFCVNDEVVVQACAGDLVVLDRATGSRRWQQSIEGASWFSPAVGEGLVLAAEAVHPARRGRHDEAGHVRAIAAFDVADGKQRWRLADFHRIHDIEDKGRTYRARAGFKPLSIADGRVLVQTASYQFRQGGSVAVLDAAAGKQRWYHRFAPKERYTHGSYRAALRGDEVVLMCGVGTVRFDAALGKVLGETRPDRKVRRNARANGACAASRATANWLMANAYLYVGPDGKARTFFGARGQCGGGVVPAQGLVFVPPAACDCGDYTRGYQALAPVVPGRPVPDEARLTGDGDTLAAPEPEGWSHFLGDPQRHSACESELQDEVKEAWRVRLAEPADDHVMRDRRLSERWLGALSAPTAAYGVVVVSLLERHELMACDAATGKEHWRVPTDGKVDSPPTLARGLAVHGCDDGSVTARRLSDGQEVWRFMAAPTDGVAMHHGHLASACPVPGSVLVLGERVVAVAGHHTDLGGLHCWALDLATGKPTAHRVIGSDQPQVVSNALTVADADGKGFWLGGADKSALHLSLDLKDLPTDAPRSIAFDRSGTRVRFRTADGRGGSTHGWKQAMRSGPARGHRIAVDDGVAYVVQDPTSSARHKVRAGQTLTLQAMSGTWREKKVHWGVSQAALGNPESISTLIKAGDRLVLGGGSRDGSKGFVLVLDAGTGTLHGMHRLPARVTECGLAVAEDRLIVCCEDGTLLAFE
jgi:outer membrane protein assembly factor BamB